jgi:uncharacterized LabA/DUF88 family protein
MQQMELDTACVYLDQNNIYPIYKKIDFAKLRDYFDALYNVIKATSFNSIDTKNQAQMKFVVYLAHNKWKSEVLDLSISSNIDNILTTNLCHDSNICCHNTIVIISGDGGFAYPLTLLAKSGYKIHVVGCKDNVSIELLKIADKLTYLEDIPDIILS